MTYVEAQSPTASVVPLARQKTRSMVERLLQMAYELPATEVEVLSDGLRALLDAQQSVRDQDGKQGEADRSLTTESSKRIGRFEDKMIRGYGPYRYLRWRSGGRHRSAYLGKCKPTEEQ